MARKMSEKKKRELAVRPKGSKGKWHLISYDDTYCRRFVPGDAEYHPVSTLDRDAICKTCAWQGLP